jgi:heme o synthase
MSRSIAISKDKAKPTALGIWASYLALIKPRLVSLVLLNVVAGFYVASSSGLDAGLLTETLVAAFFVGAGAMALNSYFERDIDAKMIRTQNRPLPTGRIKPRDGLVFGLGTSVIGVSLFLAFGHALSALIALSILVSYLLVYTPLKRKTPNATLFGSIPGALPILMGWTSATGSLDVRVWSLFFIVFFWQLPHFLSIAWMYRTDYERAKLPTLSVVDRSGTAVARQMILYMCALMPTSFLPTVIGIAGSLYGWSALVLGVLFSGVIIYAAPRLDQGARYVLRGSIAYLTLLFIILMVDKV